jgi:hypothetical protein
MTDLSRLPPSEARKLLALAAMTIRAREAKRPANVFLQIEGSEVTDEAIRAGVHLLLVERRRAAGMVEPVDLADLVICDDGRLHQKRADSVAGTTAAEIAECLAPKGLATK